MSLPAGSVKGSGAEQGNAAFSASFDYTTVQLQVSATSPAVGSVLVRPGHRPGRPVQRGVRPLRRSRPATSSSARARSSPPRPLTSQAVDLTLSGVTQDGTLTLTIPAGAILDQYGVPTLAFTGTYIVQVNSQPFPGTLPGEPPAGSLIYDPSVTGRHQLHRATPTAYTLDLAADETLSVVMTHRSRCWSATITVKDPSSNVIGSQTVHRRGPEVVLETVPIATAGTYSITLIAAAWDDNGIFRCRPS